LYRKILPNLDETHKFFERKFHEALTKVNNKSKNKSNNNDNNNNTNKSIKNIDNSIFSEEFPKLINESLVCDCSAHYVDNSLKKAIPLHTNNFKMKTEICFLCQINVVSYRFITCKHSFCSNCVRFNSVGISKCVLCIDGVNSNIDNKLLTKFEIVSEYNGNGILSEKMIKNILHSLQIMYNNNNINNTNSNTTNNNNNNNLNKNYAILTVVGRLDKSKFQKKSIDYLNDMKKTENLENILINFILMNIVENNNCFAPNSSDIPDERSCIYIYESLHINVMIVHLNIPDNHIKTDWRLRNSIITFVEFTSDFVLYLSDAIRANLTPKTAFIQLPTPTVLTINQNNIIRNLIYSPDNTVLTKIEEIMRKNEKGMSKQEWCINVLMMLYRSPKMIFYNQIARNVNNNVIDELYADPILIMYYLFIFIIIIIIIIIII
jgi:hypothetical protein